MHLIHLNQHPSMMDRRIRYFRLISYWKRLRFDRAAALIHIRSASRVGSSDFGVNRQRVERIRRALAAD
jgi:uncharacterized protein (DUF1499 family)